MAVPKGFRINMNLSRNTFGFERRQEILDEVSNKEVFLPKGVDYDDIDKTFIDYIDKEINLSIKGVKVPVIFLTLQRWSEFNKVWGVSDKYKDIKLPFITIVREPNPQKGTQQGGMMNIPGQRFYTQYKVPTIVGGKRGIDLYMIPQPTCVDFTYKVTFFTTKLRDLNKLNKLMQINYNSIQRYVFPKGHPMPTKLESVSDESRIEDFQNRRFFTQQYEILLSGYILNEDDFIVKQTVRSISTDLRVKEEAISNNIFKIIDEDGSINIDFIFNPLTENSFEFTSEFNSTFGVLSDLINITNINILINGVSVFSGGSNSVVNFTINVGDIVIIDITKVSNQSISSFKLKGNIL